MSTIDRPISVVGAPRSGTTLLFAILSSHPEVWSLYREGELFYYKYLPPERYNWSRGNALSADDATPEITQLLRRELYRGANNYQRLRPGSYSKILTNPRREKLQRYIHSLILSPLFKPDTIRLVEKNPKTCLRIPFFEAVFPDACYIFLTRDPHTNVSSLIDGWGTRGRFASHWIPGELQIQDYDESVWKFNLPPGWEEYQSGRKLEEVCAFQYRISNEAALAALSDIPEERWLIIRYEDLITSPEMCVRQVCEKVGLTYRGGLKRMAEQLPVVNASTPPSQDKWMKNYDAVMSVINEVAPIAERLGYPVD